jgi:hypothetical protein
MDVNMGQHPLAPGVQGQNHAWLATERFLGRMKECLLCGVKEEEIALLLVSQ